MSEYVCELEDARYEKAWAICSVHGENGGIKMNITDREDLARAILANNDAAALFHYCVPMLEEYAVTHNESTIGAIAGIVIAIRQILCGNTDYDEDFSVAINDLMHICIDNKLG